MLINTPIASNQVTSLLSSDAARMCDYIYFYFEYNMFTNLIKYFQCLLNDLFMCTYLKTNCMLLFVGINNTFPPGIKYQSAHAFFHMELCEYTGKNML